MNIFDLINTVDPEKINIDETMASGRRAMFRQLGDWGKKMAIAAVPFGAASYLLPKLWLHMKTM
jgi:hypothetical protein